MERLTQRLRTGEVLMASNCEEKYTEQEWICVLQDRLAAYEDSGCDPEEVLPKDKSDEIALKLMRLADLENLCSYTRLRELAEETGLTPGTFLPLGSIASSPGILAERIHLFFARDLVQGEARPDDGEFVETLWVPYQDLLDMARRGEIQDGKTLAGILKASFLLEAPQT